MKLLSVIFLASLVCPSAHSMEFVLNCRPDNNKPGSITYQAVKVAAKSNGKWVASYKIKLMGPAFPGGPQEVSLIPAGSGDENYSEYKAIDPRRLSGIRSANIENSFKWVQFSVGSGATFSCRPSFN